jgi:maltooligosyltrehalose synthase
MVIVPRFTTQLVDENHLPVGQEVWNEIHVLPPKGAPTRWLNVFTDESVETSAGPSKLALGTALRKLPVGLFVRTND